MTIEVCDKCGHPLGEGQAFCSKCGTPKISRQVTCGKCGAALEEGQTFCTKCGQKVGVIVDPQVSAAISQFNAQIQAPVGKKSNACAILAIVFGVISIIPFLNFIFLPPAIVLAIIGLVKCADRSKGAAITGAVITGISTLVSIAWLSNL